MEPIPVWRMIKDVVDHLEGELTYAEIKEYINEKWNDVNQNTITAQIIAVTVNHNSRIHYNENKNTRLSNSDSCYDILFYLSRGRVTKYNPLIHGIWEIYKDESDKSRIRLLDRSNCTFLFAWNPHNWEFNEIDQKINELQLTGRSTVIWSIQSHKKVRLGDRAFIVQVGTERKGLFASGYIVSEPKLLQHWGDKDKLVPRVTIELDILINPTHNPILTVAFLKTRFPEQQWTPQSSGIQIKSEIVSDLEKEWFDFIKLKNPVSFVDKKEKLIIEGASYQITQTAYERNVYARKICIQHYGCSCSVCGFNFKNYFGEIGEGFIHVHHLNQLSNIGKGHETDPIRDLRPVCPNCHAMLHKKNPPYSIEYLKDILTKSPNII